MIWVVKMGGSLLDSSGLSDWCQLLGKYGAGKVVIVPGGGSFADQVRHTQSSWKFDDSTAHRMALRSMDQYGLMLSGIYHTVIADTDAANKEKAQLLPVFSTEEIIDALSHAKIPVWLPSQMLDLDTSIPQNWDMTSDSLAAWLADRLGAEQLILIKTLGENVAPSDGIYLSDEGLVDPLFEHYTQNKAFKTRILRSDQYDVMQELLLSR